MSDQDLDLDVFELLEALKVDNLGSASGGAEASFSCPFHADERPSSYMNVETGAVYCHSCHERSGNPAGFVAKVMNVSFATAAGWLREAYGFDFREPEGGTMAGETDARFSASNSGQEFRYPAESWQETFTGALLSDVGDQGYEYISDRGFDSVTIADWGLGFDLLSQRVTIPVHDATGRLVGFKGRSMDPEQKPKYLILGDRSVPRYGFDPYEASQVVFGLSKSLTNRKCILCEGELNAISLASKGFDGAIALGMSYLSEAHARLILEHFNEMTIFFDTDNSGITGVWGEEGKGGIVQKLEPFITIKVVEAHEGDPASLPADRCRELIDGAQSSVAASIVFG